MLNVCYIDRLVASGAAGTVTIAGKAYALEVYYDDTPALGNAPQRVR